MLFGTKIDFKPVDVEGRSDSYKKAVAEKTKQLCIKYGENNFRQEWFNCDHLSVTRLSVWGASRWKCSNTQQTIIHRLVCNNAPEIIISNFFSHFTCRRKDRREYISTFGSTYWSSLQRCDWAKIVSNAQEEENGEIFASHRFGCLPRLCGCCLDGIYSMITFCMKL